MRVRARANTHTISNMTINCDLQRNYSSQTQDNKIPITKYPIIKRRNNLATAHRIQCPFFYFLFDFVFDGILWWLFSFAVPRLLPRPPPPPPPLELCCSFSTVDVNVPDRSKTKAASTELGAGLVERSDRSRARIRPSACSSATSALPARSSASCALLSVHLRSFDKIKRRSSNEVKANAQI